MENGRDANISKAMDAIENALAAAGFTVLDGEHDNLIFRNKDTDQDYCVKVEEIAQ